MFRRYLRLLTLSTPESRLFVWALLTVLIFLSSFSWLEDLSLYKRFGIDWAPSIGLTRAYWYLLHGDIEAAWRMNKIVFIVIGIGSIILLKDIRAIIVRRRG